MNNIFLGKPSEKIRKFLEKETETKGGKWVMYNSDSRVVAELDNYTFVSEINKVWKTLDEFKCLSFAGGSRVPPEWRFEQPGDDYTVDLSEEEKRNPNLKDIKVIRTLTEETYTLKWFKDV